MSSKAFDKITEGLNEAGAIARGIAKSARLHMPAEMDDDEAAEAGVLLADHTPAELAAEIVRLRHDCGGFYQVIGYLASKADLFDDPQTQKALDNACAAAEGDTRPHDDLLPFTAGAKG